MIEVSKEIILSDGECLSFVSWDRLRELNKDSNKLVAKLGRTPHYARKNKTNLQLLDEDIRKVKQEMDRRMALNTFSFCGLTFHFQGQFELDMPDGGTETYYILEREGVNRFGSYNWRAKVNTIELSRTELSEYLSRGAIQTKLDDPCSPLKIATDYEGPDL